MNRATICGNLGSDPELRQTRNGKSVCNFSVATNRSYTNGNGEKQQETTWHNVVAWGDLAENCDRYLTQGREVLVEGRIQKDEYTDRNGVDRKEVQIVARNVKFLSDTANANGNRRGEPKRQPSPNNPAASNNNQSNGHASNGSSGGGGGWPDESGSNSNSGETDPFDDEEIPF
jgi:single-strand DNA-binding protein